MFILLCNATGGLSLPPHDTLAVGMVTALKPRSICQACRLQERLNNGMFCSRMFLLCTPLKYDHIPYLISLLIYGTPFPSQNKPSHHVTVVRDLTASTTMD